MNALARLGMVSESPSENQTISPLSHEPQKDYYVEKDGVKYAGMHLIIDLWGASNLDSPELIDQTLCDGARAAGATILHHHFHHFEPNGGVSGVVVLQADPFPEGSVQPQPHPGERAEARPDRVMLGGIAVSFDLS